MIRSFGGRAVREILAFGEDFQFQSWSLTLGDDLGFLGLMEVAAGIWGIILLTGALVTIGGLVTVVEVLVGGGFVLFSPRLVCSDRETPDVMIVLSDGLGNFSAVAGFINFSSSLLFSSKIPWRVDPAVFRWVGLAGQDSDLTAGRMSLLF